MGFFANLLGFGPNEVRETRELWHETKALHERAKLPEIFEVCLAIRYPLTEIFESPFEDGWEPLDKLLINLLFASELYGFPDDEVLAKAVNNLEDGVDLRQFLRRKRVFLANPEAAERVVRDTLTRVAKCLLEGIEAPPASDRRSPFSVPLLTCLRDSPELMSRAVEAFYGSDMETYALFGTMRQNLLARGRALAKEGEAVPLPRDLPKKSPEELVDLYFRDDDFAEFFRGKLAFSIPEPARFEHMHIVGGSGHGKSQCLQHLILQDVERAAHRRFGFAVIDSQGDLIDKLIRLREFAPGGPLADRLVLIDPNDVAYPAGLNLFDSQLERFSGFSAVEREKILNGMIELYSYIFSALLGAELTQKQGVVFTYLARAMLVLPNPTIHTLREFIEDGERFRADIDRLEGTASHFFATQFFTRTYDETRKQILTRLWGILANPVFERMFAHPKNNVDAFAAMQAGKILVVNTAKDLLKSEGASILGRFFIALIAQATLARSAVPEEKRTPYHLYIDEAHDYFDDKIGELLNQARKYRLGITLAHQHLDQLELSLRSTILTSTSVKLVGGVNSKDAALFAREMRCDPEFIQSMRKSSGATEFACFVRHHTERPVTLSVPFGAMERRPRMSDGDFEKLLTANRSRVAAIADGTTSDVASPGNRDPGREKKPLRGAPSRKPKDDQDFYVS